VHAALSGAEDSDDDDSDGDNVTKSSQLLQYVLDCLHKIFLYDTQRFLSKERADALLGPLVDQVSVALTLNGSKTTIFLLFHFKIH